MEDISCEICGFMCPNAQDVVDKDHPYIPFSAVLQRQQNIMEMSYPMWQLEYSHRLYPGGVGIGKGIQSLAQSQVRMAEFTPVPLQGMEKVEEETILVILELHTALLGEQAGPTKCTPRGWLKSWCVFFQKQGMLLKDAPRQLRMLATGQHCMSASRFKSFGEDLGFLLTCSPGCLRILLSLPEECCYTHVYKWEGYGDFLQLRKQFRRWWRVKLDGHKGPLRITMVIPTRRGANLYRIREIDMSWPSSENGTLPKTNLSLLDDYRPGQIATEFGRIYYRRDLPAMSPSQLSARQHAILLANEYFMVYKKAINALRMMRENPKGTVIIQPSYSLLALGERELNKRRLADLFRSLPLHYECLVATSDGPNLQQQEQTCLPNFLGLNNTINTANIPQNPNIVHNRPVCSIISNTNWNLIQNTGMCYNPSCIFTGSHSGSIWESYNITSAGGLNSAVTEGHIHYIITTKQTPPMENVITDEDIINYNLPAKSTKMINDTTREEQIINEEGNNFDCGNEDNSSIQKIGDIGCKTETDKKEKKTARKLDKEYRGKKMNDLKGSWKVNGLEDENESTETESSTSGSNKIITSCAFCKKNGESASVYLSHNLMDPTTKIVTCPILRTYVCQTCNATGDYAHTRSYCPKERERAGKVQSTTLALKSTPRMSNGQFRPSNK